ncbi:MAG: hypothetical protein ACK521_01795 [bacterium]
MNNSSLSPLPELARTLTTSYAKSSDFNTKVRRNFTADYEGNEVY